MSENEKFIHKIDSFSNLIDQLNIPVSNRLQVIDREMVVEEMIGVDETHLFLNSGHLQGFAHAVGKPLERVDLISNADLYATTRQISGSGQPVQEIVANMDVYSLVQNQLFQTDENVRYQLFRTIPEQLRHYALQATKSIAHKDTYQAEIAQRQRVVYKRIFELQTSASAALATLTEQSNLDGPGVFYELVEKMKQDYTDQLRLQTKKSLLGRPVDPNIIQNYYDLVTILDTSFPSADYSSQAS